LNWPSSLLVGIESATKAMNEFGLRAALGDELVAGKTLTEDLIGAPLADLTVLEELQSYTGVTNWVLGDPVSGFYIVLPLSNQGEMAIRSGNLVPSDPDLAHVARRGEPCFGIYIGVYAGATKEARKSIMQASAMLRVGVVGCLPCFGRGATEEGANGMLRLGFKPVDGGLPDLFVQEALVSSKKSVA
jgi:hypothetical protein